jgi:hypothetical protein
MADRPGLALNRITRHGWGPDPKRVVRLVVLHQHDVMTATVWGVESGRVVELERAEAVTIPHQRGLPAVRLSDGTTWQCTPTGCSCQVPGPLRAFRPLRQVTA